MGCAASRESRRCFSIGPSPGASGSGGTELAVAGNNVKAGAALNGGPDAAGDAAGLAPGARFKRRNSFGNSKTKNLSDMTVSEMVHLLTQLKEAYDDERQAKLLGKGQRKVVNFKLHAHIAEQVAGSTPLLHTSLAVKPVSSAEEFAAKITEMKAPKETVLAVCLDLPVSTAKGAALNVGKLMGKVFLLLDQAEVAAELKAKLPSLIGKARSLVKDEQGNSVCRVSLFFDHSVDVLQHLSIFQNFLLDVTVNRAAPRTDRPGAETGSSQELSEAAKKAEADAASAGAAAPDVDFEQDAIVIPAPKSNSVVKDQEMSIISPKAISMFADFPARDQVAVSVKVETGVERFIVSNLHSFLADHGYAPKQITPQKAEEEESMPSANAIASILTILSLLNHFESTLRFEDMTEVFDKFQSLSAVSDMFGKVSLQPSDVLNTLLVTAFRRAAPEAKQQLEKQYTEIRTLLRDCFAGLEGTYHLRVLTPEIALQASVQGIAPFPLFPSIDQIHTRILQDEEREAKRAEEMAAFAHLTEFTDKDFAEFLAKVEAPIKEPWEQRYPKDREEKNVNNWLTDTGPRDWSKIWIDSSDGGVPMVRMEGLVPGLTAQQVFDHFFDSNGRMVWDNFLSHCETVAEFREKKADLFYYIIQGPASMAFEFLEYRQYQIADGDIIVLVRSCADARRPPDPKNTLGTTLYAGYRMKEMYDEANDIPITVVTGLLKQDLGTYVPGWMLSHLYDRLLAEWMIGFIRSCMDRYDVSSGR